MASASSLEYHEPASLAEALGLLSTWRGDARLLAGGVVLGPVLRERRLLETHLIGLRRVPDLRGIRQTDDGGLAIGAGTTHREAEVSPLVRGHCGAMADMLATIGNIRVRNQGTLGGIIVAAAPAFDPPTMLQAMRATLRIESPSGPRAIPAAEPSLEKDEILVAVELPPRSVTARAQWVKFAPDGSQSTPVVTVAVSLDLARDGTCTDVVVVIGGLGPTPIEAHAVSAALAGAVPTAGRIAEAAAAVIENLPTADSYGREMARVWVERGLALTTRPA